MKKRYQEDDRMLVPQYILNMTDDELATSIKKREKKMAKAHKKAIKKKNYRTIEEKLAAVGCKLPL